MIGLKDQVHKHPLTLIRGCVLLRREQVISVRRGIGERQRGLLNRLISCG